MFSPVTAAFAAQSIPRLLSNLESDNVAARRDARTELAAIGLPAVRPMMQYWMAKPNIYRIRLGVSVALTDFMRKNKNQRKRISGELGDRDIVLLMQAAADNDRTLRIYASEFLYDLGDPRTATGDVVNDGIGQSDVVRTQRGDHDFH